MSAGDAPRVASVGDPGARGRKTGFSGTPSQFGSANRHASRSNADRSLEDAPSSRYSPALLLAPQAMPSPSRAWTFEPPPAVAKTSACGSPGLQAASTRTAVPAAPREP